MKQEWMYKVTVSNGELLYEGRFVRYCYAEKVAQRKLEQFKGTGAFVYLYSRWDGTQILRVA